MVYKFKAGDRVHFTLYSGNGGTATITNTGEKNGKPVYDMDNGHWCYESQLEPSGLPPVKMCAECHRTEERTKSGRIVKIRLRDGICAACRCANEEIAADAAIRRCIFCGRDADAPGHPRYCVGRVTSNPGQAGILAARREANLTIMSIPGSDDGAIATVYYLLNLQTKKTIGRAHATSKAAAHALALVVNNENDGACVNCCEPIDTPGAFCAECR